MNVLQGIVTVLPIHHDHLFAQTFRFSKQLMESAICI